MSGFCIIICMHLLASEMHSVNIALGVFDLKNVGAKILLSASMVILFSLACSEIVLKKCKRHRTHCLIPCDNFSYSFDKFNLITLSEAEVLFK